MIPKQRVDGGELVAPVGTDLLGMQTEHGVAIVGILPAYVGDGMAGLQVDGRQKNRLAASLAGSLDNGIAVSAELLAVQVAVGVDVVQIEN